MALFNHTARAALAVEDMLMLMDNSTGNATNATVAVPHYPSGYTLPQIVVASIVVTIIMIVVVVGNMLVIIAITTEKALKNIQNWFIASLAVADFFLGLVIMPFSLANELMGYWIFGPWWCDVHSAMDVLLSTASIMNLCLISLDRYWSITQAVEYLKKRTPLRAIVMITAVWLLSALICIPPLLGWKVERAAEEQYPKCQHFDFPRGRKMVEMSLASQKILGNEKNIQISKSKENVPSAAKPSILEIDDDVIFESDEQLLEACEVAINQLNKTDIVEDVSEAKNSSIQPSTSSNDRGQINDSTEDSHKVQNGIVENQPECSGTSEVHILENYSRAVDVEAAQLEAEMLEEKENDPDYEISSNESHNEEEDEFEGKEEHERELSLPLNKKRNRTSLKEVWEKNLTKKLRMTGKQYKGYSRNREGVVSKGIPRPARQMTVTCFSNACKKMNTRHCGKFSEAERKNIFTKFWDNMNWDEKKVYITSSIEYVPKKRNSVGENSRRTGTFNYYLRKIDNSKLQVCKKMFLGTIGLKEDMVHDWIKRTEHGINVTSKPPKEDTKKSVEKRKKIGEFFDSLSKMSSHYCRKDSTKLYLEQFFQTKQALYREYKKYCDDNGFSNLILSNPVFDQIFSELNLALYQPRKDRCDICCGFETKNISELEYKKHLEKKERAREEKTKDKELAKQGKVYTFCMDLQAVKICPVVNASKIYYKTKLAVHNFTIYDMDTHVCRNYWFNETEADLSAPTFTNFILDFIKDKCTKNIPIILYSDGCCYQNRNCTLSNALLNYSIKHKIFIEQKYLEKGHTQMECDAVHSLIERKLKNRNIELPSDYVKLTKEARTKPFPLEVVDVTHDFFLNYADEKTWTYNSIRPGRKVNDPTVTDLRHLKYHFEKKIIEYKIDFNDVFQPLPARSLKYPEIEYKALHQSRLKIKQIKWKHLQEIKCVLSNDCHSFYDDLPH